MENRGFRPIGRWFESNRRSHLLGFDYPRQIASKPSFGSYTPATHTLPYVISMCQAETGFERLGII
ncbi:MAG TPA: hypothetical protein EYQ23_06770 [Verrucomicrobiales bacterium]|nr:hypothetical protein [Verrucomicrobiales bacterium]